MLVFEKQMLLFERNECLFTIHHKERTVSITQQSFLCKQVFLRASEVAV
jgi:hypothetical protein